MTKKYRISGFDLTRKHLYLRLLITSDRQKLTAISGKQSTFALFREFVTPKSSHMGDIWLYAGSRKLRLFSMHECIHAAFAASRLNCEWPVAEQRREEYIASTAEAIYEKVLPYLDS
jgi:hypothetical protein